MAQSVAGKLLVASPEVGDFFRRSVVIVVEHNEEGALGLTLNQPSGTPLGDTIPEIAEWLGGNHVIHLGGPVSPNALTCIGEFEDPNRSQRLIVDSVGMVDLEQPVELERFRVFAGYAGWSPGQLESELEQDGWIITEPTRDDPFSDGDLWSEVLTRMGGEYELLARLPDDPSVN
ncbi:MAG: YqgE/AlgH family protein [bacterium]